MDVKAKARIVSYALFVAVFAVWALFFVIISNYIDDNVEQQITLAAGQIIERLGGGFSSAERLSYSLKNDERVKALIREEDRRAFFSIAEAVSTTSEAMNSDFINSVIIYGADGHSYQLIGALGNKTCARLYSMISSRTLPGHLSLEADGQKYICYADAITPDGIVAVLTEEETILEALRAYDQSGALLVTVRAGDETVTSNTGDARAFSDTSRPVIHSGLGVTPYEISVSADASYMSASVVYFTIGALITAVIFAAVLFTRTKNAEVLAAEIGRQKALVFSLQKQINAHFTVNTMEAIRSFIMQRDLDKAGTLISGLMRLVRYAHSKEEYINVWDELEILKYYAEIMNGRYGGKLTAEFDFDDALMDASMPRMLLQPLMENAVEHGFKNMDGGCVITVKAVLSGEGILCAVRDNGRGMDEAGLAALRERLNEPHGSADGLSNIAIVNIKNRLSYYCGGEARISVGNAEGGGFEVTLMIPLTKEGEA